MVDLNQITVNVNDIIPPDNFATVDAGVKTGTVYTKEQDNVWRKEVESTVQSGIKGVAKPNTPYDPVTNPYPTPWAIGDPNLYEKYDVKESGSFPNFLKADNLPIEVTSQQISLNKVQIWVKNGISELYLNSNNGKDERLTPVISIVNIPPSKNLANPTGLAASYYTTAGVLVTPAAVNWIHWKGAILPNTQYTISGLASLGNVYVRLAFFTSANVFISPVIMATGNANSVTFTSPSNAANVAANLQNALNIGVDPQNTVFPNQLQLELGPTATSFVKYQEASTSEFVDYNKLGNKPLNYSEVYYSFNPVGGSASKGLFIVFVRRTGSNNMYVGYFLNHDYNMTDAVYSDQWRIAHAHNYTFNGTSMALTAEYGGLGVGENEIVYKRTIPDSEDFTGGTHGDEIFDSVDFLVDGKIISIATPIDLTSCADFRMIQKSKTFTTANVGEVLTSHTQETLHIKIDTFKDGGYKTENYLKALKNAGTCFLYHGIACISRLNGTYMINDEGAKVPIQADNVTNKLSGYNLREVNYSNPTNGLGARVTSSIISNDALDVLCYLFVHDRPSPTYYDAKYYRRTPDAPFNLNNWFKSEMKVEFFGI